MSEYNPVPAQIACLVSFQYIRQPGCLGCMIGLGRAGVITRSHGIEHDNEHFVVVKIIGLAPVCLVRVGVPAVVGVCNKGVKYRAFAETVLIAGTIIIISIMIALGRGYGPVFIKFTCHVRIAYNLGGDFSNLIHNVAGHKVESVVPVKSVRRV